tara:strand:- start:297 stop:500 length:204 start_codon:yes stop_codon:yes gene_type:complete
VSKSNNPCIILLASDNQLALQSFPTKRKYAYDLIKVYQEAKRANNFKNSQKAIFKIPGYNLIPCDGH